MNATAAWKVWLVLIGVFLAGAVVGGVGALRVHKSMVESGRSQGHFGPRLLKFYADRLELTEEQRTETEALVRQAWEDMREQREATREIMRGLEEQITEILTPEQQEKYAKFQAERREKMKKALERRRNNADRGWPRRRPSPDKDNDPAQTESEPAAPSPPGS